MHRRLTRSLLAAIVVVGACSAPPAADPSPVATPDPTASPSVSPSTALSPSAEPSPAASPSRSPSVEPVLAWRRLDPTGNSPRAREDHTWTVDPQSGLAYLFGGRDGARALDDLWSYDLAADRWRRITVEGSAPAARFGHTGTWVPGIGLVIWSGQVGSDFFADVWAYDPDAGRWRRLSASGGPKARYGSCAALGPDGRLWVSHGFTEDTGRFADTWAYDFDRRRWRDETPDGRIATIRCLHDCLWTADGRFLIYAGQTTGAPAIGDLWWRTVGDGWTRVADVRPPARQLYGLAVVHAGTAGEWAIVFGGGDKDRGKLADLWSLDLTDLSWREEAPTGRGPSARSGAAMIADPSGSRVVLFGGLSKGGTENDVWELSLDG